MDDLKSQIRKLAKVMEENTLLDYELSGYMKDSVRRKIFRETATMRIKEKKKYSYVDQMINGIDSGGSGKFLVQMSGADKGAVFDTKAYGQRGRYVGHVDKVIKKYEDGNASMKALVMERALKNRLKRS